MFFVEDTDRMSYALMTEKDADLLFELDQDPQVMKFINGGNVTSRDDINNIFVPRLMSYTNPDKGWGMWKMTLKNSGEFVGWILLRPKSFFDEGRDDNNLEIGWRIKQKFWRQGLTTEAAQAVVDEAKKHQQADFIHAIAAEENVASTSVMKKLGLKYVKTYMHTDPLFETEVVYYEASIGS